MTATLPVDLATLDPEVSFLSGFEADGTLAATAFATLKSDKAGTYAPSSAQFKWGGGRAGTPGGTVTYGFDPGSAWTDAEQAVFTAGLTLWSDEADITFAEVAPGTPADITIKRGHDHQAYEDDHEPRDPVGTRGVSNPSRGVVISIDTRPQDFGPIDRPFLDGGIALSTVVHEEGHALGLGHTGPYNDGDGVKPATHQFSPFDQLPYSVMSYIEPTNRAATFYADYPVDARPAFTNGYENSPTTPMIDDILAAQRIYGAPVATALSGGQVFGFDCNIEDASRLMFDFTQNQHPFVTLFDTGTDNTLDLSGFSTPSTVSLTPGTFSSCDQATDNIAIAYGTAIGAVVCGAGNDTVTGSAGNDWIEGGAGDDDLTGNGGNDIFVFRPRSGHDTITDFAAAGPDRDVLGISDPGVSSVAALMRRTTSVDGSAVLHLDRHDTITLTGVSKAQLEAHPADFRFHV